MISLSIFERAVPTRPVSIAFPSGFILTYSVPLMCHCVAEARK